mmetsp:Transcript_12051/g.19897  ORF Transcript_12051/g.19897 Transcript_12051/m.19897 type:complete len:315 (-) Transcript_12051:215-1159(-)
MMSGAEETNNDDKIMRCAGCGIAGGDDVKLMKCSGCQLVRYCGVKCQREHRPKHKKECKKIAAELHDEILFKQPESSDLGDCPICCLPLPLDRHKTSMMMPCCAKSICNGCFGFNLKREAEGRLEPKCAFCRNVIPRSDHYNWLKKSLMKRVEANDPAALCQMATKTLEERDFRSSFEYLTKAVELGDVFSHYNLSLMYQNGDYVEKDEKKQLYHLEQAAIGGNADARYNLGCLEVKSCRLDRAVKHWNIAANMGHDQSLDALKHVYQKGVLKKEVFARALRGHQAAVDATKSPQREQSAAFQKWSAERERMKT